MDRRTALKRGSSVAASLLIFLGGVKLYSLYKIPDLSMLDTQRQLLADLADAIVPPTAGAPGAKDAGVGDVLARMVRDCCDRKTQNHFLDGLATLVKRVRSKYGKSFGQCSEAEKADILHYFEREAEPISAWFGKADRKLEGDPFFVTLKNYVVLGYCTSRLGATQALRYDYIPGKYEGVVRLLPGQRAWATK